MKRNEFNNILQEIHKTDLVRALLQEEGDSFAVSSPEADPGDLTLDTYIYVSQETKSGELKKFEFIICEVWLKPQNVYTIVNSQKERIEENFWILFYDKGTYYLKKGIRGPIGVHVHLKHEKE